MGRRRRRSEGLGERNSGAWRWAPKVNLLAAGFDHEDRHGILVWDVATRQLKPVVLPSLDLVSDVVFSPDGRHLAATCGDGGTALFDTSTFQRHLFVAGYNPIGVAFSPDSQLLAVPSIHFGVVRLWSVTANRELAVLNHPGDPRWVAFRADGQALITADPRFVRIWNLGGNEEKRVLSGHEGGTPGMAFSPDGKLLASVGKDMKATVWDPGTGQVVHRLSGFSGVPHAVAFSSDGQLLAIGDRSGAIRLWQVGSWQELSPPMHNIRWIWAVAFSPDGRYFAACGEPGGVVLWRLDRQPARDGDKVRWELVEPARLSDRRAHFLCFSPDSHLLAWCSDALEIWDLGKSRTFPSPPARLLGSLFSVAFLPDGRQMTMIGPMRVPEVWDVTTGQKVFSFPGEDSGGRRYSTIASAIALSADGSWLAQQGTAVKVWDLENKNLLLVLPEERSTPWCLAWSPNKECLAVGSEHGGIAIWNLPKMRAQLATIGLDW